MTILEQKQLKEKQANGEEDLIPANQNSKYKINKYEKHLVHVLVENRVHDTRTGAPISKPAQVIKLYPKVFKKMTEGKGVTPAHNPFANYTHKEVIHNPSIAASEPEKQKELEDETLETLRELHLVELGYSAEEELTKETIIELIKDNRDANNGK